MKVVSPGFKYELSWFGGMARWHQNRELTFLKQGESEKASHPGTNVQEVLRVLIDKTKYEMHRSPDERNSRILYHLRVAIWLLEADAANRRRRDWAIADRLERIELLPTCEDCGHIECTGSCVGHSIQKGDL